MADLEGVIIGGAIGVAGSLIGPLILEWRKQLYARQDKRREKLEELVTAIYAHHHWLQDLYRIKVQGESGDISPTPFAKIEAIKQIYFPQFDTLVNDLAVAGNAYQEFMLRNAPILQQLDLSREAHVPIRNDFVQARAHYQRCVNTLLDELKAYAKREFQ